MTRQEHGPHAVLATANRSKVVEVSRIVGNRLGCLTTLADLGLAPPEEDGISYAANARKKAGACCLETGFPSLADDSGLEVFALNRRPGLRSARYADDPEKRIARLLAELDQLGPGADRRARFVCVVAFARPGQSIVTFRGVVSGRIAHEPRGNRGFGFDPIFHLPRLGRTMAELDDAEKDHISHRGRALLKFVSWYEAQETIGPDAVSRGGAS